MKRTPSNRQSQFTPVQLRSASITSLAPVKIVDSWDSAIAKAKQKIARLKEDVRTFREMRDSGEPWPNAQSEDQKSESCHSV
jgi:hypothetical protein